MSMLERQRSHYVEDIVLAIAAFRSVPDPEISLRHILCLCLKQARASL